MTDSRSIIGILVFIGTLVFAVWLGISIVTNQIETLAQVTGVSLLIICALLGKRIWILIPFMGSINLTLMVPGQPTTLLLAQALFIGFSTLLLLMRQLPCKPALTELGIWSILLSTCVLQTYLRNPVGLNIFGGESIGARPYAIFAISLFSSIILGTLRIPAFDLKWVLRLSIVGGLLNFFALTIGHFLPSLGVWVGAVNLNSVNSGIDQGGPYGVDQASRVTFVRDIARNISLWVGTFISPIRACFHPLWAPLVLLSFAFAAFSGYRNEIGAIGLSYLVAIAYRGGFGAVLFSSMTLLVVIAILAIVNMAAPLPANIQRSLSFLPGTWEESHVQSSKDSTEWRIEMWKEALLSDYWITNKLLGDGLGMTKQELNYIHSFQQNQIGGVLGSGKLSKQQEFMMAAGNYHSGPVVTIRTIGYVGLFILVAAQIRLAVHAHRQIKRASGTEWYTLTLLVGIPLIWAPIFFVFVIGDFAPATASFLLGAAMVRLLENNLPLPPYMKTARRNNGFSPIPEHITSGAQ